MLHRNPELRKIAAEKPFEFEPHKTLNYILLSNMHAEGGRWDEVERGWWVKKEEDKDNLVAAGLKLIIMFMRSLPMIAQPKMAETCGTLKSFMSQPCFGGTCTGWWPLWKVLATCLKSVLTYLPVDDCSWRNDQEQVKMFIENFKPFI